MLFSAFSGIFRSSSAPSEETVALHNELATQDIVLNGLRENPQVNAALIEYNHQVWQELGQQHFPETVNSQPDNPIAFFNTQTQGALNLGRLTVRAGDEILARKQLAVGLLLKSCAEMNPEVSLTDLLNDADYAASLEREALQSAVNLTIAWDPNKQNQPGSDLEVVLVTYLNREEQVQAMFEQMLQQMGDRLKGWGLEMASLKGFYALAQLLVTCDAQLVRDAAGRVTAQLAFNGNVQMVELLYPHLRACQCDVDPKSCVLEKAATAKQTQVMTYLLTNYPLDFPRETRIQLLRNMSQRGRDDIVTFLLTDFRNDFSARDILSLRGTPGFQDTSLSYTQLLVAPALQSLTQRVGRFLSWGSPRQNGAAAEPGNDATTVDPGSLPLIEAQPKETDKKKDGSSKEGGGRKRFAIEGSSMPPGGEVVSLSEASAVYTPAAAAASSPPAVVADPLSSSPANENGALVVRKKRGK